MLKTFFFGATVLTSVVTWAKPEMAWVPEASDLVVVGHALQAEDVAATKAWEKAFAPLGVDVKSMDAEVLEVMQKESPEALAFFKALGVSEDLKSHAFDAFTVALLLPQAGKDEGVAVVTIGFTKPLDKAALVASFKKVLASMSMARLTEESEEWFFITLGQKDKVEALLAAKVDGATIQMIVGDDLERVREMTKVPFKAMDESSVFAKAFKAPSAYTSTVLVAKDFASLVKTSPKAYEEMKAIVPSFASLGEVVIKMMTEGVCYVVDVTLNNDTEAHAKECYELMIGWRMMVRTFASQMFPTCSAVATEINGIKIDHKGKQTTLRVKLDPVRIAAICEEIIKAQSTQAQDQYLVPSESTSVEDVLDDDDIMLIDDDILIDFEDEEMEDILDAIDE